MTTISKECTVLVLYFPLIIAVHEVCIGPNVSAEQNITLTPFIPNPEKFRQYSEFLTAMSILMFH